jgi:hypothetical protein
MRELLRHASGRVLLCIAVLAGAAVGGIAAGFAARPGQPPEISAVVAEMTATDTVDLRFPADWVEVASPMPTMLAFASADGAMTLFNPMPTYPIPEAEAEAEAAAAPVEALPRPKSAAQAPSAPAKVALASASSKPAVLAHKRSNAVLNDSQIASIKRRLNLTRDQERYWPAVEAELRKMEYKKDASGKPTQGTRTASVDLSKVDVEGLKAAGFPLVMSFSDDQKRELKSLAHLLGLEKVISTF